MSDIVKKINQNLALFHGSNLMGQPFFRVIFSDDELEKRFGTFCEFYGKIFIREFSGLREVPKYNYLQHKWVLERWIPPVYSHTIEIPETKYGSYEPIYVFQDEFGNALPVLENFIEKIIWNLLHPALPGYRASLLRTEDETAIEKEIEFNRMVLEDQGRSWIGHRLHSKEGVVVL